jgi:eight-cysteine-cluster-containing protein
VLVAGNHSPVTGPAGRSQMLKATQFYLRSQSSRTSSGNNNATKPCIRTGCSGQVCADEEVVTTCEYRTEYECYKKAKCERQTNGECGFTDTPELRRCLKRN